MSKNEPDNDFGTRTWFVGEEEESDNTPEDTLIPGQHADSATSGNDSLIAGDGLSAAPPSLGEDELSAGQLNHSDSAIAGADEKPADPVAENAKWDSPWGKGRPGWHLECSAMSRRYLGEAFDIHGGGIDLRFPHHENEQAQSHGAGWPFAKYWMHNAWVTIKGEKMSKSLGNSLVVSEILKTTPAAVLRLALGTTHYRSTVEYSPETLEQAGETWNKFASSLARFAQAAPKVAQASAQELAEASLPEAFCAAMDDDLNIAAAQAVIHEKIKQANTAFEGGKTDEGAQVAIQIRAMLEILGLDPLSEQWRETDSGNDSAAAAALEKLVADQLEERLQARKEKDWARADGIRDRLSAAGIIIEDGASGSTWHLG